ncbi:MAG: Na+/H+ antiporter NhaC family protein, partial [Aliifodinibius sp.]|nr:Na+/H+ antiporter NhaC family protein [Fodinibius sp.]NIW43561.1 Na+/H+ antiporter NhaC family protein [Gammaproteobacteria bacterium]NIX59056.1 Na+/H+ antiporter NhaC family protein [candidate division Zixibacteria bacterium]NIY29647.1 Na+/H+ antiporter NhaC family protein [Fodinibius sp.]
MGRTNLKVVLGEEATQISFRSIPAFLSVVPPLLAILLALITRQVIVALFMGIWIGVTFIYDYRVHVGFLKTVDTYIIQAINSPDHISIIVFSMVLGGMVGVITRSGGTQGIVDFLSRYARDSRRGQLATWAMGIFIFFDDYANTLIVGNTMRPLTDKLRISREKLSYLVDSTAAPVANIAIISTWIGYELGLISQSFDALNVDMNPYLIFIQTIPYNFYPIYALIFGFLIAFLLRDFGSMRQAEIRVNKTGEVLSPTATPLSDVSASEMDADPNKPKRWF